MPRYRVVIQELASYEVEVEADDPDTAERKGMNKFEADGPETSLSCDVHSREVSVFPIPAI